MVICDPQYIGKRLKRKRFLSHTSISIVYKKYIVQQQLKKQMIGMDDHVKKCVSSYHQCRDLFQVVCQYVFAFPSCCNMHVMRFNSSCTRRSSSSSRTNILTLFDVKITAKVAYKKTSTVMKTLCSMSFSDSPLGFVHLVL